MEVTWKARAACRGSDVDFFPVMESKIGYTFAQHPELVEAFEAKVAAAVAVCDTCPVRTECAEFAQNERDGIWAGVLHESRHTRNNRQKAAADRERRLRERESA